jgi:hypothetical protein
MRRSSPLACACVVWHIYSMRSRLPLALTRPSPRHGSSARPRGKVKNWGRASMSKVNELHPSNSGRHCEEQR